MFITQRLARADLDDIGAGRLVDAISPPVPVKTYHQTRRRTHGAGALRILPLRTPNARCGTGYATHLQPASNAGILSTLRAVTGLSIHHSHAPTTTSLVARQKALTSLLPVNSMDMRFAMPCGGHHLCP